MPVGPSSGPGARFETSQVDPKSGEYGKSGFSEKRDLDTWHFIMRGSDILTRIPFIEELKGKRDNVVLVPRRV